MNPPRPIIVADIGGTNARFAMASRHADSAGSWHLQHRKDYACAEHPDFESALGHYLDTLPCDAPGGLCVGIAGPVENNAVAMTNLDWSVDGNAVMSRFNLERCELINDFTALSCATLQLGEEDLVEICPGSALPSRVRAILGPGTGLGVSTLAPCRAGWVCLPGEGGHATLAPTSPFENSLIQHMSGESGRIPAGEVLSGRGLVRLYRSVCELEDHDARAEAPSDVTAAALDHSDPAAIVTVATFLRLLGGFAGDLALTVGAKGGVFLAGGILPRILPILINSEFEACFRDKGAMSHYVEHIRVSLITSNDAALIGAAIWANDM